MFGLVDEPRTHIPQRGSPRMFKINWIEKYFSRVKPTHVIALWVPITCYMLYQAATHGLSPLRAAANVALGVLIWTLLEYVLHRWVFHFVPQGKMQEDLSFLIHGIHHDYPWDADRLVMPPAISILIAAALWFPYQWAFGSPGHYAYFAGTIIGYLWYDLGHYAWHHVKPRTALGRYLRSYHLIHHFKTPNSRYGVSSPLWDYVFRTAPKEGDTLATAPAAAKEA